MMPLTSNIKVLEKEDEADNSQGISFHYETISVETDRENLTKLDARLSEFLQPNDFFYIHDLTNQLKLFVEESGVQDGTITVQILHTSATLTVNELDEPMLLADLARKLKGFAPKEEQYLHNSPLRVANRCEEDTHCDRNGDAHVKATLFGSPSVTLIVRHGQLVVGRWQKVALIEFDGPRKREVLIQLMGR